MIKKLGGLAVVCIMVLGASHSVSAQTTSSSAAFQAQIQQIIAAIQSLQTILNQLMAAGVSDTSMLPASVVPATFTQTQTVVTASLAAQNSLGDVTLDGVVNIIDAQQISRYVSGLMSFSAQQLQNADVNTDGVIDATDANLIAQYSVGSITTFPRGGIPSVSLTVNGTHTPPTLVAGSYVDLAWSATYLLNGSCSIADIAGNIVHGLNNTMRTGPITANTTFTVTCTGSDSSGVSRSVSDSILVTVTQTGAPAVSLQANGYSSTGYQSPQVDVGNASTVTFSWNSTNTSSCTTYGQSKLLLSDGTYWNVYTLPTSGTKTFSTANQRDGNGNLVNYATIGVQCWGNTSLASSDSKGITVTWSNIVTTTTSTLLGDATLDGLVNIIDAQQISRYASGLTNFSAQQLQNADVNKDGQVNLTDSDLIAQYSVGNITSFPTASVALWGDVNGDGVVNIMDVQQLSRYVGGLSIATPDLALARGDVNADGAVNILDVQQLSRFSAGLSASARINTQIVPANGANVFSAIRAAIQNIQNQLNSGSVSN